MNQTKLTILSAPNATRKWGGVMVMEIIRWCIASVRASTVCYVCILSAVVTFVTGGPLIVYSEVVALDECAAAPDEGTTTQTTKPPKSPPKGVIISNGEV